MLGIDEIRNSLISNPYLTDDIKQNIMGLIVHFSKNFSMINLSNFNQRIKTLKILRGSKFLIKGSSLYDPIANEILLNQTKLDTHDCKHILMRELLNVITAKGNFTGFNKDNAYEALNIGYTEIIANFLTGDEEECEYEEEIIATNMITKIIGNDIMFNAYFNNDVSLIMNVVC